MAALNASADNLTSLDGSVSMGVEEDEDGIFLTDSAKIVLSSKLLTVFIPVFYIIVFMVGFPANAMAIWVFLFRTKKRNPASILLTNLALSDLLFIIWLPLKISYHFKGNSWTFGEPLCKVLVGFFYGNMYCSTFFIAVISVQRFWAVAHPLSRALTNQVAVCVSLGVWLVILLATIPLYLYDQVLKIINLNITTCHDVCRISQSHIPIRYFLTMGIVGYVVPCGVCVVAYVLLFRSLRRSIMDPKIKKKRKKAVILMVTVLVIFLVCFTPSNIMLMVHYSVEDSDSQNITYQVYIVALCLGNLNSCLDPFMYYFSSKEFREHVENMLKCRSERSAQQMKVAHTPMRSSTDTHTPSTRTSAVDHQGEDPLNTCE